MFIFDNIFYSDIQRVKVCIVAKWFGFRIMYEIQLHFLDFWILDDGQIKDILTSHVTFTIQKPDTKKFGI